MSESKDDKIKVLLIEDETEVAELYRLKLSLDGYEVITAENGEAGLEKALKENPELILLDIKLPKMDVFEVLPNLRNTENTK